MAKVTDLPIEILYNILKYLDNDSDKKNFIIEDLLIKDIKTKYKNILPVSEIYIDIRIVTKKEKDLYSNVKSYLLSNSIFSNVNYFKICKLYLDEITSIDYYNNNKRIRLPKEGSIEIFIGQEIKNSIYESVIIYKKKVKPVHKKYFERKKKRILFDTKYGLPLSLMRNLYIDKNWEKILKNNDKIISRNERFSNNYLLGPSTYKNKIYEPKEYLNLHFPNNQEDEWSLFYTVSSDYIFNVSSDEMVNFFIRKTDIEKINNSDYTNIETFAVHVKT